MMYEKGCRSSAAARRCIESWLLVSGALLSGCMHDWNVAEKARVDLDGGSDGETEVAHVIASDSSADGELDTPQEEDPDSGLRAPDATAPRVDTSIEPAPDASQDGALDGQLSDAAAPDATSEARFCAGLDAGFCADFEDGMLDAFSWQELTSATPASLSVVEGGAGPGSLALRSSLSGAAEETARAALFLTDGEPSWFHAAFDFLPQLSLLAQDGAVFWFKLSEQIGTRFPGVGLSTDASGSQLLIHTFDGVEESYQAYPAEALPTGWVHVDVAITFGVSGSATLRFNDKLAAVFTGPLHAPDVAQSYLQLGLYAQQPSASSALYDNVVVEFAP